MYAYTLIQQVEAAETVEDVEGIPFLLTPKRVNAAINGVSQ
jgi:hypothetical protein